MKAEIIREGLMTVDILRPKPFGIRKNCIVDQVLLSREFHDHLINCAPTKTEDMNTPFSIQFERYNFHSVIVHTTDVNLSMNKLL